MRYQLIFQFPASTEEDFDAIMEANEPLHDASRSESPDSPFEHDGHDFGLGKLNFFLYTDHPEEAFSAARAMIEEHARGREFSAASTDTESPDWQVVWQIHWPPGLKTFELM